jgi:hypothetical protein
MDAAAVYRQGLSSVISRQPPQNIYLRNPPPSRHRDDASESEAASHRIAHTLTACCRCRQVSRCQCALPWSLSLRILLLRFATPAAELRSAFLRLTRFRIQRKTRCDPTLPRCLPCERSGSVCEYFDTTKGRKISRFYVVKLQEKVRQLEAELAHYTDEDNEYPRNNEDIVRPGGLVRLNESDETPRYLGPSSGIAMTRLLMEGAKRFTDATRISELVPDVRARRIERLNRMQSISFGGGGGLRGPNERKKSYPLISAHPAQSLPTRPIVDKLLEIFTQRGTWATWCVPRRKEGNKTPGRPLSPVLPADSPNSAGPGTHPP